MIKIGIDTNLISNLADAGCSKTNPIQNNEVRSLMNILENHSYDNLLRLYNSFLIQVQILGGKKKLTGNPKQMVEWLMSFMLPNSNKLATKKQRETNHKKLEPEFGHYFRTKTGKKLKKDLQDLYILMDNITCGFKFLITYDAQFIQKCQNSEIKKYIIVGTASDIEKHLVKHKSYKKRW